MKNPILAGAVAGAVADIALVASVYVFGSLGVLEPIGGSMEIWDLSMLKEVNVK